jgi:hypothetical protein
MHASIEQAPVVADHAAHLHSTPGSRRSRHRPRWWRHCCCRGCASPRAAAARRGCARAAAARTGGALAAEGTPRGGMRRVGAVGSGREEAGTAAAGLRGGWGCAVAALAAPAWLHTALVLGPAQGCTAQRRGAAIVLDPFAEQRARPRCAPGARVHACMRACRRTVLAGVPRGGRPRVLRPAGVAWRRGVPRVLGWVPWDGCVLSWPSWIPAHAGIACISGGFSRHGPRTSPLPASPRGWMSSHVFSAKMRGRSNERVSRSTWRGWRSLGTHTCDKECNLSVA